MNLSFLFVLLISCSSLDKIKSEEATESEFNKQLKSVIMKLNYSKSVCSSNIIKSFIIIFIFTQTLNAILKIKK